MKTHNPDNLTDTQIGVAEGWRLLNEDEVGHYEQHFGAEWVYPYLIDGSPMGGGVGHVRFATAFEVVRSARAQDKQEEAAQG